MVVKTIGMVVVAAFAAITEGVVNAAIRHLALNQFCRQGRQPIILVFGPTIFDCDIPALGKAGLAQASKECGH
jgi:hypothetical protein